MTEKEQDQKIDIVDIHERQDLEEFLHLLLRCVSTHPNANHPSFWPQDEDGRIKKHVLHQFLIEELNIEDQQAVPLLATLLNKLNNLITKEISREDFYIKCDLRFKPLFEKFKKFDQRLEFARVELEEGLKYIITVEGVEPNEAFFTIEVNMNTMEVMPILLKLDDPGLANAIIERFENWLTYEDIDPVTLAMIEDIIRGHRAKLELFGKK